MKRASMIREPAFAKVNLFLDVLGRLSNGYHHLHSVMVFADVGEWVSIAPADAASFVMSGPESAGLPANPNDNLILKAQELFCRQAGINALHDIHLHKTMPVSSGIGGGSADAAAALRALNALYGQRCSQAELLEIAAQLGADVPACLISGPVLLDGIGPEIQPVTISGCEQGILVNPRESVSTADVFRRLSARLLPTPDDDAVRTPETLWDLKAITAKTNHLSRTAELLCPEIAAVLQALRALPGVTLARMSGSGATCFALFESSAQANAAYERLRAAKPGWWMRRANFE